MANLRIGDQAIPFNLPGVDGKKHAWEDFKDKKAVAVIFSCNHCPYVQAWEDRIIAIQREYADQGLAIVAINANDAKKYPADSFDEMKKRAKMKGFNFPYLHDEDQSIARAYGAERTPEIFLFDGDGILRYHGRVDDNYEDPSKVTSHDFRNAVEATLAGTPVAVPETTPVGCTIKWA